MTSSNSRNCSQLGRTVELLLLLFLVAACFVVLSVLEDFDFLALLEETLADLGIFAKR